MSKTLHPNQLAALKRHAKKPGEPPGMIYGNWLKQLSPEERELHYTQRKERKALKDAMRERLDSAQQIWLDMLTKAAVRQAEKAIDQGDTQAFMAVWDRTVGKPSSTVDMTVAKPDTVDDIVDELVAQQLAQNDNNEDEDNDNGA